MKAIPMQDCDELEQRDEYRKRQERSADPMPAWRAQDAGEEVDAGRIPGAHQQRAHSRHDRPREQPVSRIGQQVQNDKRRDEEPE